jgi:hypothetical protein
MKLSERLKAEQAFLERTLGDSVICVTCSAKLGTFADACTAGFEEWCPGFIAVKKAKSDFAKSLIAKMERT